MSWFTTFSDVPTSPQHLLDPREVVEEADLPIGLDREIRLNQLRRQVAYSYIPLIQVPIHVGKNKQS